MSEPDFNKFLDDLIVESAKRQTGVNIEAIDFFDLCEDVHPGFAPTWRDMAIGRLDELGWARFKPYSDAPGRRALKITHAGIARASEVRLQRRKPTAWERIKAIPRSDWIALLALIVSAIALLKGE
ncbi:hypothetical protein LY632_09065 [Erythrobacter sp. SDW2]|uniref:hypothetical protein n=1 Tax=Erythrobacter sp. SDW2 TaxID=2907154 RepID=UPI001F29C209|nr:hypothetical protein [Erythrobacter sp. SDW2]UIP05857.1 hypothetical protein LY632_09065 [Erythrobacter sp. SDW2]